MTNTDAALNILEFVRNSDHAGLRHLSTCYVAGEQDGRVPEKLIPNYNPHGSARFQCGTGMARSLHELSEQALRRSPKAEEVASVSITGPGQRSMPPRICRGLPWKIRFAKIACRPNDLPYRGRNSTRSG